MRANETWQRYSRPSGRTMYEVSKGRQARYLKEQMEYRKRLRWAVSGLWKAIKRSRR